MPNIVGQIPQFTPDYGTAPTPTPEVKQDDVITPPSETGTPPELLPEEKPAVTEEKPNGDGTGQEPVSGQTDLELANQALQEERVKLLKDISELRGQRRELKQQDLVKVNQQIDELSDVHPNDVTLIERILRSKGYVTKEESSKMFYEAVKQEELGKFLDKYPEYKPENDTNDTNWSLLQRELGFYKMPDDPHLISQVLERAHRGIVKAPTSGRQPSATQRQVQVASVGAGGVQRSPSKKSLDAEKRVMLKQGGWSEEEIREIESSLPE